MDFSTPRKRRPFEPTLPMINVVFLLLIFFLLTARIAPRPPFDVTPPRTNHQTQTDTAPVLFLSAEGDLFYQGVTGAGALLELAAVIGPDSAVTIRADAQTPALSVASVLRDLQAMGLGRVQIVTQPK